MDAGLSGYFDNNHYTIVMVRMYPWQKIYAKIYVGICDCVTAVCSYVIHLECFECDGGHMGSFEEKVDQVIMMIIMIGDDPNTTIKIHFYLFFYHRYTYLRFCLYFMCIMMYVIPSPQFQSSTSTTTTTALTTFSEMCLGTSSFLSCTSLSVLLPVFFLLSTTVQLPVFLLFMKHKWCDDYYLLLLCSCVLTKFFLQNRSSSHPNSTTKQNSTIPTCTKDPYVLLTKVFMSIIILFQL